MFLCSWLPSVRRALSPAHRAPSAIPRSCCDRCSNWLQHRCRRKSNPPSRPPFLVDYRNPSSSGSHPQPPSGQSLSYLPPPFSVNVSLIFVTPPPLLYSDSQNVMWICTGRASVKPAMVVLRRCFPFLPRNHPLLSPNPLSESCDQWLSNTVTAWLYWSHSLSSSSTVFLPFDLLQHSIDHRLTSSFFVSG